MRVDWLRTLINVHLSNGFPYGLVDGHSIDIDGGSRDSG